MGRFVSKDAWMGDYSQPLSLNRWNYVEGNPINFSDPNGRIPEPPKPSPPYTSNYNQKVQPQNITWVSNSLANEISQNLAPIFDDTGKKIENTNAAQFQIAGNKIACDLDLSTENPYDCIPGTIRNQNFCGDVAISAILYTTYSSVTTSKVLEDFRKNNNLSSSASTGYQIIADYFNSYFANKFRAAVIIPPPTLNLLHGWIKGQIGSGKVILSAVAIYQGTTSENIDPISGADFSGRVSSTGNDIGHWVIITGISSQRREGNEDSAWNWIRIFNPFDNQTEYYWWEDFHLAWYEKVGNYKSITVEKLP